MDEIFGHQKLLSGTEDSKSVIVFSLMKERRWITTAARRTAGAISLELLLLKGTAAPVSAKSFPWISYYESEAMDSHLTSNWNRPSSWKAPPVLLAFCFTRIGKPDSEDTIESRYRNPTNPEIRATQASQHWKQLKNLSVGSVLTLCSDQC